MENSPLNKVINVHWFGAVDKLPEGTKYIGRPSVRGNRYSSKTGKYTKEECIALHLIDVYQSLTVTKDELRLLREELGGHDLACWCKQPKKIVGCHGDNYLHILSDVCKDRVYDRSIIFYLMDDLRMVLKSLLDRILRSSDNSDFLFLYVSFSDMRLNVDYALRHCRVKDCPIANVQFLLAQMIVDLRLADQDTDLTVIEYRFAHVCWLSNKFVTGRPDLNPEPLYPDLPLKRRVKGKHNHD